MAVEIGTGTLGSGVTFQKPFLSAPNVIIGMTSDNLGYAASVATTGFTPTAATLTGSGAGTSCVYLAIGPARL